MDTQEKSLNEWVKIYVFKGDTQQATIQMPFGDN